MKKRIISMFLAFVMCLAPVSVCLAEDTNTEVTGAAGAGGVNWGGGSPTAGALPGQAGTAVASVYTAAKTVAAVVAVFMVVFFGVKYLTAGAGDKAKTKEMMVPFLIGAVLIFMAPDIVQWIFGFFGTGTPKA